MSSDAEWTKSLNNALCDWSLEWSKKLTEVSGQVSFREKPDFTLLTDFDLACEDSLKNIYSLHAPKGTFLGEETSATDDSFTNSVFSQDFIFVCDPIDGTWNFVHGEKWFSPAVGTFCRSDKGYFPCHGFVLFPARNEHYFTEGERVFLQKPGMNAVNEYRPEGRAQGKEFKIASYREELNILATHVDPSLSVCIDVTNASISDIMRVAFGEIDAAFICPKWWDFAGALAIAQKLGVQVYCSKSMEPKEHFSVSDFQLTGGESHWRIKTPLIVCRPQALEILRGN